MLFIAGAPHAGLGGGLYIAGGIASVLDTTIHHNRAFGGDGAYCLGP